MPLTNTLPPELVLIPSTVSYCLPAMSADTVAPFGQSLVVVVFFASSVFVIFISSWF